MNYTILQEAIKQGDLPIEVDTWSVYRAFEQVLDGRHKRGVRVPRGLDFDADRARQIGGDDDPISYRGVGTEAQRGGCARCYQERGRAFRARRPTAMCCGRWMRSRVNEVVTQTGLVLKEQVVGDKENELSIVSQFLTPVWVKGRVISADARPSQHTFCTEVTHGGGYFLLIAKGNQPTLRDDLHLFFSEPPSRLRKPQPRTC